MVRVLNLVQNKKKIIRFGHAKKVKLNESGKHVFNDQI